MARPPQLGGYRSTPTPICGAVRRLCRIDSFSIQLRRLRAVGKPERVPRPQEASAKTDDLTRTPTGTIRGLAGHLFVSIKEKPCEEV